MRIRPSSRLSAVAIFLLCVYCIVSLILEISLTPKDMSIRQIEQRFLTQQTMSEVDSPTPEEFIFFNYEYSLLFITTPGYGTSTLRGDMISEEIARMNLTNFKHSVMSQAEFSTRRPKTFMCVLVKFNRIKSLAKEHCTYVVHDILDFGFGELPADELVRVGGDSIDMYISSSRFYANQIRELGKGAVTIYHQQTNDFNQIVHGSPLDKVQTIGFMAGAKRNIPGEEFFEQLGNYSCSLGIQMFVIHQMTFHMDTPEHRVASYGECSDPQSTAAQRKYEVLEKNSHDKDYYPEQRWFQELPVKIDIGLLRPPPDLQGLEQKPATRLIWWWSHGIPTIIYPYQSYIEVAKEFNYEIEGHIPLAESLEDVQHLIVELSKNSRYRQHLSRVGIKAARAFTPHKTASKFISLFKKMAVSPDLINISLD